MEYRTFGRTGLRVSRIGLGGFPFGGVNRAAGWDPWTLEGRRAALATIERALARGVTYVDTAPGYGDGLSEEIFGEALAGRRERRGEPAAAAHRPCRRDAVPRRRVRARGRAPHPRRAAAGARAPPGR